MSEELHKYNDVFKKKLENHESPVSDDLFDNLMQKRTGYNDFFKEKLAEHESPFPVDLFDKLIKNREGSDEQPSDAPLRERVSEYTSEVPYDKFNDIINERERRRRALAWRSAAAILLFFAAYFLFIKYDFIVNNKGEKTENAPDLSKNKSQVSNDLNKEEANKSLAKLENTEGVSFSKKAKSITYNNQSAILNNQSNNSVSNSANYLTNIAAEQQIIIPTISTFSNIQTAAVTEPNSLLTESGGLESSSNVASNSQLSTQNNQSVRLNAEDLSFDNLSIFKLKNITLPSRDLVNPCKIGPGDGCPTFGKQRKRGGGEKAFYVDVYGAPEYAFRRLSENLPEMTHYLEARDTVEKPYYAFSAGVRAALVFQNGLSVRTGVAYAQTNEIAVFDSLGIGKKVVTETYVQNAAGGKDTIRKTEITSGIFRTTIYNRYRTIDIPLQLGFEFPMNDYWTFSVNGGVNFNISAWRKADILGENFKRQGVSSDLGSDNPVFRNTLGLSINGSFAAYRQLTGNLQLMIEPSVRYYLQPITQSDYALKQAYTNVGLNIGLRMRL